MKCKAIGGIYYANDTSKLDFLKHYTVLQDCLQLVRMLDMVK